MNIRKDKGVTLISLIITIILLMILMGITVGTILQNRTLDVARDAKDEIESDINKKRWNYSRNKKYNKSNRPNGLCT